MKTETSWGVGDKVRVRKKFEYGTFVLKVTETFKTETGVEMVRGERRRGGAQVDTITVRADRIQGEAASNRKRETGPKLTKTEMRALFDKAYAAGLEAGKTVGVTPMVVGTPKNLMGSLTGGDDGGFDENEPVYFVEGGVCGYAWVTVRPANSSFALWLKKNKGASTGYYGGMQLWVREFGQSMQRKEAFAKAFAEVLREAGINAFSESRMD